MVNNRLRLGHLYGGEVLYQPGESLPPRTLTDYELVYIIRGEVSYTYDNTTVSVSPGTLILGHPEGREQYRWDTSKPTRHAYFHFSIEQMPEHWPAPETWPHVRKNASPLIINLFKHVLQHIYEHTDWPAVAPKYRDCLLVETLLDTLFEKHDSEKISLEQERPEPVRRALKWMRQQIDEQPYEKISLDEIAKAAGCTAKHLCRLFSTTLGYPPAKTVTLMRLQLSLGLLTRTNLPITEIASRCGFDNALYYSRCFSKTFGRSPSQIRKEYLQGIPPPVNPLPVDVIPRTQW